MSPKVVLEATFGWYWAADTLAAAGAEVHLAHPLGVKAFTYRRVKNDERDAADLAVQRIPRDSVIGTVKDAITARRGKEAKNIAKVAAGGS